MVYALIVHSPKSDADGVAFGTEFMQPWSWPQIREKLALGSPHDIFVEVTHDVDMLKRFRAILHKFREGESYRIPSSEIGDDRCAEKVFNYLDRKVQEATTAAASGNACMYCGEQLILDQNCSTTQWYKKRGSRKCKSCVECFAANASDTSGYTCMRCGVQLIQEQNCSRTQWWKPRGHAKCNDCVSA